MNVPGAEFPIGCWITTSTGPCAWAGVATVMVVSFVTLNPTPGVPSKVTPVAPVKPVPVMVTGVPPVTGPLGGVIDEMAGSATKVKVPGPESPLGLCTTTSVAPGACAGVVAVIVVSFTTVNAVPAVPPKVTPVPPVKPVPVMVTAVPPVSGPLVGVREVTVGAARKVKVPGPESPFGPVTTTSVAPGACAGVVTVMVVSSTTVKAVPGVPPKVTPVVPVNPLPVIVTGVPPVAGPLVGVSEPRTGGTASAFGPTVAFATLSVSAWVPGSTEARSAVSVNTPPAVDWLLAVSETTPLSTGAIAGTSVAVTGASTEVPSVVIAVPMPPNGPSRALSTVLSGRPRAMPATLMPLVLPARSCPIDSFTLMTGRPRALTCAVTVRAFVVFVSTVCTRETSEPSRPLTLVSMPVSVAALSRLVFGASPSSVVIAPRSTETSPVPRSMLTPG